MRALYKKMMPRLGLIILALSLVGCTDSPIYKEANHNISKTQAEIQKTQLMKPKKIKQVSVNNSVYVSNVPFKMEPKWFKNKVQLHGTITLKQAMDIFTKGVNISVLYNNDVEQNKSVHLKFSGTVKTALKLIEEKTHYHYNISGDTLKWENKVTRMFQISIMPGNNAFALGKSQSVDSGTKTGGASQYSTLTANLSVWSDITKELPALISKQGSFTVSETTSSVTVTDNWENIQKVNAWIHALNAALSKQVRIRVQILQVQLNKQFERGINWELMTKNFAMNGAMGPNLFSKLALGTLATDASGATFAGTISTGFLNGTQLFIMALSDEGNVSIKNNPIITTLNNQVAEIQQVTDTGYLKETSVTYDSSDGSSDSSSPTVSLTPGNVTTGLKLYVLPKIQGNKIYLQVSADLSSLTKLTTFSSSQGSSSSDSDSSSGSNSSNNSGSSTSIQLPTVTSKKFNQRSLLDNGQTLIIAGFNGTKDQTNRTKYFNLPVTGGASGLTDKTETVLLITPEIINN